MDELVEAGLLTCKICGKVFGSVRGKHLHISKSHKVKLKDYYKKFYPKKSKLYNKTIPFKNVKQYFDTDFLNRQEIVEWSLNEDKKTTSEYLKKLLINRKNKKNITYSLSEVELELCDFPNIECFKHVFGSYSKICDSIGLKNVLNKNLPSDFFESNNEELKIFIDTREQKPISFQNEEAMKLDFGDYTCAAPHYDYTYIDRKSEGDFKSTLSGENFERFKRELDRARQFNSYIFILIESDIQRIKKNNVFSPYKSKLPYIWHNVKEIAQDYKDCCQFVFAGNRKGLKKLIPKILLNGKSIWNVDIQYFINLKINEQTTRKDNMVS